MQFSLTPHHHIPLIMMTIADVSNLVAYLLHILSIINQFLLTNAKIVLGVYQYPFLQLGKELCHFRNILIVAWKITTLNLSLWDENLNWMFCIRYANNMWITVTITRVRIYVTSGQNEFSIKIMILLHYWKKNCLTSFNQILELYLNNPINLHWISKR